MTSLFLDTTPEAEVVLINLLRQAPPWRKLEMVGELNKTVRAFSINGLKQRYSNAGNVELRRRLADILLGADLALKVYGPLPDEEA